MSFIGRGRRPYGTSGALRQGELYKRSTNGQLLEIWADVSTILGGPKKAVKGMNLDVCLEYLEWKIGLTRVARTHPCLQEIQPSAPWQEGHGPWHAGCWGRIPPHQLCKPQSTPVTGPSRDGNLRVVMGTANSCMGKNGKPSHCPEVRMQCTRRECLRCSILCRL